MFNRPDTQYCLNKAAECDRKARQAQDPETAKSFERIAASWRVAAATRDFSDRVEDILRNLRNAPNPRA